MEYKYTMQRQEAALAIENIVVVYHHSVQVLRGLSLGVPARQIVALLGSNGAGKTTTLNDGPTAKLMNDPDVQRFYLGYADSGADLASFRHVKHYKRRKRWLS